MPDTPAAHRFESMVHGLIATGHSVRGVARDAGVSAATISRAKLGESRAPSAETFHRVERVWKAAGEPSVK